MVVVCWNAGCFNIKIHYVPIFHCELNPIEMFWAFLKSIFKKENEQSTNGYIVLNLILKSRIDYKNTETNLRLFGRFFRIVERYNNGATYA